MKRDTIHRSGEQGSNTVECALILPLLLMVMFLMVDLSRFFWTSHVVSAAAADGARLAILNEPSDNEVRQTVAARIADGGVAQAPAVTLSPRLPSTPVTVTVSVDFQYLVIPGFIAGLAGVRSVSSAAVMEHEP